MDNNDDVDDDSAKKRKMKMIINFSLWFNKTYKFIPNTCRIVVYVYTYDGYAVSYIGMCCMLYVLITHKMRKGKLEHKKEEEK